MRKVKVRIIEHDVVLTATIDKHNIATVRMFGADCKFRKHQYEIVDVQ